MDRDIALNDLVYSLTSKSFELLKNIQTATPEQFFRINQQSYALFVDFFHLLSPLSKKPELLLQIQKTYLEDVFSLSQQQFFSWANWQSILTIDKPYNAADWADNPFYHSVIQQHLLFSKHINNLIEQLEYEDKAYAKRIKFFINQMLDALSPANYLLTNPELLIETLQTQGNNLLKGLDNFLNDIEIDSSHLLIRMLDPQEFKVGIDLATTPGKVIYRNEMMELIHYSPQTKFCYSPPLLIVPPWINKYYILDLSPHNSYIGWIVKQGFSVFVISWINPDSSYAKKGLEDYLTEGSVKALSIIRQQLKVNQVHILGFCIGGTLVACTLAYLKSIKKNWVKSATFLASLIDFSDPGDISVFIDENRILHIEELMHAKGYLDGRVMANTFNLLRPKDLFWSFFVKNYFLGKKTPLFDILYWNADLTNMPQRMLSEYLHWMYLDNDLIKPNKIHLNQIAIDVSKISLPTFFVATKKDHIAPWQSIYLGFQAMQEEKRFLLGESGHIAGIINPPKNKKYGFYKNLNTNLDTNMDAKSWLDNATYHSGSWWPEWILWLKENSSQKKITVKKPDSLVFKPIAEAPGTYVFQSYKKN